MYAQGILELRDIVISFLACLVWNMQAYAAIDTKDNEIQVIPYAQPGSQSQIPEKPSPFHLPAMPLGVIVDQPDVPGIQEGRPYKLPNIGKRYSRFASNFKSPVWSI